MNSEEFNELKKQYNKAINALYLEVDSSIASDVKRISEEYRKEYARIQIEKDRERVKDAVHESGLYHNHIGLDKIYKNTPINLD